MKTADPSRNKKYLYWKPTYEWLSKFINENNLKTFLELGVAGGQNIKHQSENSKLEKIIGVDEYQPTSWDMHHHLNVDDIYGSFDKLYFEVNSLLLSLRTPSLLMRKSSIEASNFFNDEEFDCIFIDASHDFKNCFRDICLWYPKVKKNGFLVGHDWDNPNHPGVNKAVKKYFKNNIRELKTVSEPYYIWYIKV